MCDPSSHFQLLTADVLIGQIFSFIPSRSTLGCLCCVNKYMKSILFSPDCCELWNKSSHIVGICIDDSCPLCPIKRVKCGEMSALSLLRHCPLQKLKLHCFVTHIPECLEAISKQGIIQVLELKLTNKSTSPSLEHLLSNSAVFQNSSKTVWSLKSLILDSSNLQHVKLAGRSLLLDILGRSLEDLSMVGNSPAGVFTSLSSRCPNVKHLRVDKAISHVDFSAYRNDKLESLELCRTNFVISTPLHFPMLKMFRFTLAYRLDCTNVEEMVMCLPSNLQSLDLEISGDTVNEAIVAISRRLRVLESLVLEGSYEAGIISRSALEQLGRECGGNLRSFEVKALKSVSPLIFEPGSFAVLGESFPMLQRIRIMYTDESVAALPLLLSQGLSMEELRLWERPKWLRPTRWLQMNAAVASIAAQFPHIRVILESA